MKVFAWRKVAVCSLMVLGSLVGSLQQTAHADLTTGLLGHWNLDGGSLVDASGNGRTLTATGVGGAPVSNATGKVRGSYTFASITNPVQVLVAPSIALTASDSVTVTGWINPSTLQPGFTSTSPHSIFRFYRASGGMDLNLRVRDSLLEVFYANPNSNNQTTFTVQLNTWTFVAATQTGTQLKIYMNDLPPRTFTVNGGQIYDRLLIGAVANVAANGRGFEGQIDEIRAYSRALSDAEILQLYTSKLTLSDTGIDFGDHDPADGISTRTLQIGNENGLPLDVSTIVVGGPDSAEFSYSVLSGTNPVNHGTTLTLQVTFSPSSPDNATRYAELDLIHNDPLWSGMTVVPITGTAVPVELSLLAID